MLVTQFLVLLVTFVHLGFVLPENEVLELNNENWLKISEGEWIIKFYAPWCPACKKFDTVWEDVRKFTVNYRSKLNMGQVNVDKEHQLSTRFFVMHLPIIIHAKDGVFREYKGSREFSSIIDYIELELWKDTLPIPWYRSPTSRVLSMLVFISSWTKEAVDIYNKLSEEGKYPGWLIIIISLLLVIGISTLFALIMANVLVFVLGVFFKPAKMPLPPDSVKKNSPKIVISTNKGDIPSHDAGEQKETKLKKRHVRKE